MRTEGVSKPQTTVAVSETSASKVSAKPARRPAPYGDAKLFTGDALRARSTGQPSVHPQLQVRKPTEIAPAFVRPTANETAIGKAFDALPVRAVEAKVRLLTENQESWLGIWHTLKTADKVLDATYFIFNRDVFGAAFLGTMLRKQREGTQTRLLLDASGDTLGRNGFTQTWRGQDYLQALVNAGGDVRVYHPLHKKVPKHLVKGHGSLLGISVNHDKLVRNERLAVTGGRNISHDYFVSPADRKDVYRDTDVLVEGAQAARELSKAFDKEFLAEDLCFKVQPDALGDLHNRDAELIGASYLMDAWLEGPALRETEKEALRTDSSARTARARALLDGVLAKLEKDGVTPPSFWGKRKMMKLAEELVGYPQMAGAYAKFDPAEGMRGPSAVKILDRTSLGGAAPDTIGPSLIALAARAKERIVITNPYVVITENMLKALEEAGTRGVKIDILTNSPDSSDSMLTQAFFLQDWPKLMARVPNLRLFVFTGDQKLHAKTALADGEIATVGSYNMDLLSTKVNGELVLAAKSPALSRDLSLAFARDIANPLQQVREYTIARNADGTPALVDGKPVVTSGPEHHMSGFDRAKYAVMSWLAGLAKNLPALAPLRAFES